MDSHEEVEDNPISHDDIQWKLKNIKDRPEYKAFKAFWTKFDAITDEYDPRIHADEYEWKDYEKSVQEAYLDSLKTFKGAFDVIRHRDYRANKRNTLKQIMDKLNIIETKLEHQTKMQINEHQLTHE